MLETYGTAIATSHTVLHLIKKKGTTGVDGTNLPRE